MAAEADSKAAEMVEIVREIQRRVRERYPQGNLDGAAIELPDLLRILQARDSAEAKVAAIGTVNPRPPGLLNYLAQKLKRAVARALDWHIREQIEFNRAAVSAIQATLDAMNDYNRALVGLHTEMRRQFEEFFSKLEAELPAFREEVRELKDVRTHWSQWRQEWERKLSVNEVQFLRSVADLQAAFQHRATLMESNFRGIVEAQHNSYEGALNRSGSEIQGRLWADLEKIRLEYERLIHNELRVVRQRLAAAPAAAQELAPPVDALKFADRFRGVEEYVRVNQGFYMPYFAGRTAVLDIGCGRGEFLEKLREAGVAARGIEINAECVSLCRAKGLEALEADMFSYLDSLEEASLDGIFCAQVVEHLALFDLPKLIGLAARKLDRGGVIAIETPNPECLAIFASHFYLDPTHTRPVPPRLLAHYLEEAGFGSIEVHKLSPAEESMPSLRDLPEDFRKDFFGGLDYAVIAKRL